MSGFAHVDGSESEPSYSQHTNNPAHVASIYQDTLRPLDDIAVRFRQISPLVRLMAPQFIYRVLSYMVTAIPLRMRLRVWKYLVQVGAGRWQGLGAQRIPGGMYVKYGPHIRPVEAQATHFVSTHTSLPVPVIVDTFSVKDETHRDQTWIIMSRLPGDNLADYYMDITPEVEERLSGQLAHIMAPLRAIAPPTSAVCGFDQGPIFCERLALGSSPVGPFEDIDAFHRGILYRAGTLQIPDQEDAQLIHETIKRAHSRPHRVCLSHNDLGPHNILVNEDWDITGIIDWEACAWMPDYWELTKGTFLYQFQDGSWERIMTSAFSGYTEELKAERYIVSYRRCYA